MMQSMSEILGKSHLTPTKIVENDDTIGYKFQRKQTLKNFEKILAEIVFDVVRNYPSEIILDIGNVLYSKQNLDQIDFYLHFFQILPLFGVKRVVIILDSESKIKKIKSQLKRHSCKHLKLDVIFILSYNKR